MGGLQVLNLGQKTIMDRLAEIERRITTIERTIGVALGENLMPYAVTTHRATQPRVDQSMSVNIGSGARQAPGHQPALG